MADISNVNDNSLVIGTPSDDSIYNSGTNVTINAYEGNDTVENYGSNVTINGGAGEDSIENWYGSSAVIDGGDGADTIANLGGVVSTIMGGAGNDVIQEGGVLSTIYGGSGNDSVDNSWNGGTVYVYTSGNDTISGFVKTNTLVIDSEYSVTEEDDSLIINVPNRGIITVTGVRLNVIKIVSSLDEIQPFNLIKNSESYIEVIGTSANDYIWNQGAGATLDGDAGDDYIVQDIFSFTEDSSASINGGIGNDYLKTFGSFVTVDGGEGADLIQVLDQYGDESDPRRYTDAVINGGAGNDTIENSVANATIDGGTGDDELWNYGSNATISGGAGNNSIWNTGENVTINAGTGNNYIYNDGGTSALINGGASNDSIINSGLYASIDGGAGKDSLYSWYTTSYVSMDGGDDDDYIHNDSPFSTVTGGVGDDTINNYAENTFVDGGTGNDYIYMHEHMDWKDETETWDYVSSPDNVTINGGDGNDTIFNNIYGYRAGANVSINGGAGDDSINLASGSGTTVNVSEGDNTINIGAAISDLMVEGFNVGDVIQLASSPESLTTIDGGIVADNVTIMGISAIATGGTVWTTSTNSINYRSGQTAGASLDGNTITYSTVSSASDEFTVTGLSSTVGVSVNGLQAILSASALDGKSGTIAISGGSYVLSLASDVDTPESTASGWNNVGSDGRAVYGAGMTAGWSLSSDGRSVTYASESSADSVLVLEGIAAGTSLADISEDGQVVLWAENFGSNGVTVASNPNNYRFNLSGDFEGNSFTGTDNADTITNYGDNISIDAGAGNDSISNAAPSGYAISAENSTLNGGEGNDTIFSYQSRNVSISGGTGDDFLFNDDGGTNVTMSGGTGNDQLNNDAANVTIDGGAGADNIINQAAEVSINGGNDNDTIFNSDDNTTINGGAGDDSIYLYIGTAAIVNVSEGNDTISVGSSTTDFVVEGFNVGDVIQLASVPDELTTIDGGIVADNVTIMGISAIATGGEPSWTTSTNSITYRSGQTAGATLDGNTITYSTVSSPSDEFTITGLSSTVGVSVDGSQVILDSTALDGKSGTISISGDSSYFLSLASNVETPSITSGGWNNVGSDGRAVYGGSGITAGWSLSEDSRSVTFAEGNADSLLVLDGVAAGTSLADISSDTVYLTAENFGSNGVTVTSNPNDYSFGLSGNFNGNSFTGTANADTIHNYGDNISIDAGAGDDSVFGNGDESTLYGGAGNDTIRNVGGADISINGGVGDDFLFNDYGGTNVTMIGGEGNDILSNDDANVTIDGGDGADTIANGGSGANVSINGGEGNDSIYNDKDNVTIEAGAGDDNVDNANSVNDVRIDLGAGNDTFYTGDFTTNATTFGGDGDDYIENAGGSNPYVDGGNGNDYIHNSSYGIAGTILGGAGADSIENGGDFASIDSGAGNDSITNSGGSYVSINGGSDGDIIINFATYSGSAITAYPDNALLDGGDGDDEIWNGDYSNRGGNNATILGGAGNDFLRNEGNNSYLNGGDGNDYMLTGDYYVSGVTADGGAGDDILFINSQNSSMYGGAGNDSIITESYMSSVDNATLDGGDDDDYIDKGNNESHVTMNGGAGNDIIRNVGGADISINGGAGNDSINLVSGSGATVNVSEGNDTISVGLSVADFVVEGFGVGDVILLSETVDELTTIDGGIVAGNVTIRGISAATGGTGWTTSTDRITYQSGQTAGASLDGGTITYSTVSSPSDEFTITGLSSTLGVSVDSSQAVLGASALYGKRGTVSISGGSYVLSLNSDVDVPVSTSGGWNSIGSDGMAIYSGSGTTEGWALADDSKSVTFTEGNADTLLALAGLRSGTSLTDISSGTVYLTADNFGASGVTVTSNPNGYVFNLSGNFNGNSFTGTAGDDTITNEGSNIRIDGVAGNDSINLVSGTGATVNVGTGNNTINLGASIADLMVDGFGVGDVIVLSETPDELTAIDGGIVAGNVTIGGISAVAQDGFDWTTDYNSITYSNVLTAGATLDGNTITYSTETLSGSEFTITGLSSTVGVSVDGLQVILGAAALSGVTGTVSISGGSYALALASDVAIPVSIAGTWDEVGSDGVAIYRGDGTSEGWALADDSKSVTFAEGGADSILVLEGVAPGTSLTGISDGTVYLTAENFGASGVTVTSNPNGYSFDLSGDFNGNSFTGTEGADSINSNGYNILINGVAGDDSINSNGENATVAGGEGNDAINITGNNNSLDGGAGDDYVSLQSGLAVIISYTEGQGNDTVYGYSESVELQINAESGWESVTSGNDVIINVNEGSSITLVDAAGIEPEEEPEIINEELPGRVVFASWGYGFTPREDSPLYGSPALSEVSAEDSSAGVNMSDGDEWNSSTESEYIVTPTNE